MLILIYLNIINLGVVITIAKKKLINYKVNNFVFYMNNFNNFFI